ncbi:hypothetical protein PsW64_02662 [Pseudovibrio sp. W64]|uniref:hypothetical protein n=1 Tax=Pseudovibrio sp. W64 TaxID=1735583 RepID=UPI0007AE814A|nr:hypothetical protein [Pseudovibrio sp. W64]KZK80981.1 hypothetical protein PsW64_02662 [Pseudovibrio sp. W64]
MVKGTLEVTEYQWAQKVYKQNSWPFDAYDGDPTPASIEAHCKSRSAQYKAELKSYKALKPTLQTDAQMQTFDSLCEQTQSRMKNADYLLQTGDFLDADSTLDDIAALVDGIGILVGKSRASEPQKNGIDGKQTAESAAPHVDPLKALQQRATEFSAKLKGYKAERKILVSKDQKTLFDQLFKQAASTMTYVTNLVKSGDTAGADQRLFDAEAQLQGVQQVLEIQKQIVRETENIKTAIKDTNTRLSEANGLRKTIKSPQEQKAFSDSSKRVKVQIKQVEGLLKRHELDACQTELKVLGNLVEKVESYVKFVPVDPSLSKQLKTTRIEIQSCYQQVNEVPDKALKRDFEKNYQVAISLLAETEDLIEGHGRSSEEAIAANLATLKNLTEALIGCVVSAKEAATQQATNQPTGRRSRPNSASKNAAQNALNKALSDCTGSLDVAQANLNELLRSGSEIKDAALASSFAQYNSAAQTYITEGKQYVEDRKLQEARGKLATCEDAINSMRFFLESAQGSPDLQAPEQQPSPHDQTASPSQSDPIASHQEAQLNEERLLEETRQRASSIRNALKEARKREKRLKQQQASITDQQLMAQFVSMIEQADKTIRDVGVMLSSRRDGRIEYSEQRLPLIDQLYQKAQEILDLNNTPQQHPKTQGAQKTSDDGAKQALTDQLKQLKNVIAVSVANESTISDPKILDEIATYKMLSDQMVSQIELYLENNDTKAARDTLQQLQDVSKNLQACVKQQPGSAQEEKRAEPEPITTPNIAEAKKWAKSLKGLKASIPNEDKIPVFENCQLLSSELIPMIERSIRSGNMAEAEALLEQVAGLMREVQEIMSEKKYILVPYKHAAPGILNNVDSRKTPSGPNPELYCEEQDGKFCLKHALNACLGFGAVSPQDMEDALLQNTCEGYKNQSDIITFGEVREYYPGLTIEEMRRQISEDADGFFLKSAKKQFELLYEGMTPEDYIRERGADPHTGMAIIKSKQQQLGVPNLKDTHLDKPNSEADLQANVKKVTDLTKDGTVDRLIVGAGAHFIALRRNTEGEWFEVDSKSPTARKVELEEYVRLKAKQHKDEAITIMHFDGDVNADATKGASQPKR